MNETTPDPADVHTGTDRVELTEECAEDLWLELYGDLRNAIKALSDQWEQRGNKREDLGWDRCAEELRALLHSEGEYDDLLGRGEYAEPSREELVRQRDAARVELVAANTRNRELEELAEVGFKRAEFAEAELAAANARCAELEAKVEGYSYWSMVQKNAALQATLDRVTALADEWEAAEVGMPSPDTALSGNECAAELRAALTPEGTA